MSLSSVNTTAGSRSLLFVVLLTAANLRTPITATGPILDNICQTFGLSAAQAGLLNFIPLMMFAALAPISAWAGNRFGLEKTLWAALWLIGIGSGLRIIGNESGLWCGTLVLSGGIAAANVLLPPLIKRDAQQHTAKYIGLYASTMAITASIASGVAAPLAAFSEGGWTLSLAVWLLPVIVALFAWRPLLARAAVPRTQAAAPTPAGLSPWRSWLGWQVSLFMGLQSLVFYTLIAWFTPYAQSNGFSQVSAGWLLFLYQIVAVAANLACMSAIRRLRDQRLLGFIASLAIFSGVAGLLLFPALAALWLIVAGLGAGASMVLSLSLFSLRTTHPHQASHLSGMAQCVGYSLAALGPLFFGMLHQQLHSWSLPLLALVGMSLLQMMLAPLVGASRQIGS
ncbi:MFS transporter (plasmid) [Duffyella gerundensis]|jgi:CP family cyanate transporter-like MFS transporter|uniref:CynX/NimT family MFS transporter n=1 Tax=Duffyella gerundensis TaxID=1619313 RepID=UPI0016ADFC22|nr:MFS transporter [Duffyella gerundensis]QTO56214.1 MFS transporter [Duffyella gerundensis]